MLNRCYSGKFQVGNPTYIGCSVAPEWLSFMVFRSWMIKQDWDGKHLDKDILVNGNKLYSPQNCVFIDSKTNNLLIDSAAARGDLPIGVSANGRGYQAKCSKDGKRRQLGHYDTIEKASRAYKEFKAEVNSGIFPTRDKLVDIKDNEFELFMKGLDRP